MEVKQQEVGSNTCNEFSTSKCALYSNEGGISEADLGYEQICQCNRCDRCPPLRGKDCAVGNKSRFHPYSCGAYDEASKLHICGDCYTSCDFTASSFPMLLKKFVTKARRVEAEVFQHMLCEKTVDCFEKVIYSCIEKWKTDHYEHGKVGTILAVTQYPDEHYSILIVYVFQGGIGHLCHYYPYGCSHVPTRTGLRIQILEELEASLNRKSGLMWKSYHILKEKVNCKDATAKRIQQINLWEPDLRLRQLYYWEPQMKKRQQAKAILMNAQKVQAAHETPSEMISQVLPNETPETQLIASTQDNDAQEQIGESEVGCSGSLQDETHEPVGQGVATSDESNQDSQVIQDQNAISEEEGSSSGQPENSVISEADSQVIQDKNAISEEEGSSSGQPGNAADGIKGRLRGSAGKSTDAGNSTNTAAQEAPNLIKIKYVDRKYWMLHKDDDKWYHYTRREVNELAGNISFRGNLYDAAKFALSRKNCSQKGYALSHGSRKKRRVGYHVTVPSGNLLVRLPPPITSPLSVCVERCVQL